MLVEKYLFIVIHPGDIARSYLPITIINPENQKAINDSLKNNKDENYLYRPFKI